MKAEINKIGYLIITPENQKDAEDLKEWKRNYNLYSYPIIQLPLPQGERIVPN